MIKTFRHKGLKRLFELGRSRAVSPDLARRLLRQLDFLNRAVSPADMNLPGYRFHGLGGEPKRFAADVSGNYRLTFGWDGVDAVEVDLEDYH